MSQKVEKIQIQKKKNFPRGISKTGRNAGTSVSHHKESALKEIKGEIM